MPGSPEGRQRGSCGVSTEIEQQLNGSGGRQCLRHCTVTAGAPSKGVFCPCSAPAFKEAGSLGSFRLRVLTELPRPQRQEGVGFIFECYQIVIKRGVKSCQCNAAPGEHPPPTASSARSRALHPLCSQTHNCISSFLRG